MGTLSPYDGLTVDSGVTLEPAGLVAGSGGLTLEPQTVELYVTLNAVAPAPNETDDTTGFTSADAPDTIASVSSPVDPQGGSFALQCSANVMANPDWFVSQDLMTDLNLSADIIYDLSFRARHVGSGDDVSIILGGSSSLDSGGPRYTFNEFTNTDLTFVEFRTVVLLNGATPNSFFGPRETAGGNNGGVFISIVSITAPTFSEGVEQNTASNATSPSNETDSTTGWVAGGTPDIFASVMSGDSEGGDFAIEVNSNGAASANWRATTDLTSLLGNNVIAGRDYLLTVRLRHVGSGSPVVFGLSNSDNNNASNRTMTQEVNTGDNTYQNFTFAFTHLAGQTNFFGVRENGGANTGGVLISVLSVKQLT